MSVVLTEKKQSEMPQELKDGLRILARIIAREFLKSQSKNGALEAQTDDGSPEHLQHE